jgi:hypothetical protein
MKLQIEASATAINELIALIDNQPNLVEIKDQIMKAITLDNHNQSQEVPKEGDDPIIERSE